MSTNRLAALASAAVLVVSLGAPRAARAQGTFASETIQGRTCYIYTPSKPAPNAPLIMMLHGCTQNPTDFATGTNMNAVAEPLGWYVVYPEQPSSANSSECWNWYVTADQSRGSGEPALLAAIAQQVVQSKGCDPSRVYVAGLSAGAAMTVILGATYPDVFAAIGVCSGLEYQAATDLTSALTAMSSGGPSPTQQGQVAWNAMGSAARLVPCMVFHGSSDTTVAPVNANQIVTEWVTTDNLAPNGQAHTTLPTSPSSTTNGTSPGGMGYTISNYADAAGTTIVSFCLVSGMPHAWSGGSSAGTYTEPNGPDASSMLATFFSGFTISGPVSSAPAKGTSTSTTTSTSSKTSTSSTTTSTSSTSTSSTKASSGTSSGTVTSTPVKAIPLTTVADPPSGVYTGSVSVTLRPNRAATTYYTLDGSKPTTSSAVASGPITLAATGTSATKTTIEFFSVDSSGTTEAVKTAQYTLLPGMASTAPCPCAGTSTTVVLASQASGDGSVSTLMALPGVLLVSDLGSTFGEYDRAIVTFDTSSIPAGSRIVSAQLQVNVQLVVGTIGTVIVDVQEGDFGGSTTIAPADFGAQATVAGAASLSLPATAGAWADVGLPASTFPAILSGQVQVRLHESAPQAATPSSVTLAGGIESTNGPQLVVTYMP
jgi:poly(hydroxyalkanoate) depolymerase family esterase